MSGSFDAGSVFVRLFGVVEDNGFNEFERKILRAKAEAAKNINAQLGADVDWTKFEGWKQKIKEIDEQNKALTQKVKNELKERERAEKASANLKILILKNNARQFDALQKANQRSLEAHIKEETRIYAEASRENIRRDKAAAAERTRIHAEALRENERIDKQLATSHEQALREDIRRAKQLTAASEQADRTRARISIANAKALNKETDKLFKSAAGAGGGGGGGGLRRLGHDADDSSGGIRRLASSLNIIPKNLFAIQTRIPLVGWGFMAASVASVIPVVISLAGALGPITGLLGALPGLTLAAGGSFLTLALGLKGVGSALSAAWTAQNSALAGSAKSADRAGDAVKGIADAERGVEDAQRSAKQAQQDLNKAREDARNRVRDMRLEVERAALAESGARLSQTEAYQELGRVEADSTSTSLELAQAKQRVKEAEQGLDDTRRDGAKNAKDLREAEKQGVNGMPEVVSARKTLADAERSVADSRRQVSAASRNAARINETLSDSTDQLATKMAALSPAGRSFVNFMRREMFPTFRSLQKTTQEGLLPGVEKGFRAASENLGVFRKVVEAYSKTLGDAAEKQGEFLGQKDTGKDLWNVFKQGDGLVRKLSDALIILEDGFLNVGVAAKPLITWLGDISIRLSKMFDQWAQAGRESGKLQEFFRRSIQNTELFVSALWHLTAGLVHIGSIGRRVWGQDMLGGIASAAKKFDEWTTSVRGARDIEGYFRLWRRRWEGITNAIGQVVGRYKELRREGKSVSQSLVELFAEVAVDIIAALANNLAKAIPRLVSAFVNGFIEADGWGKLVLAGWFIHKFGPPGAFGGIGKWAAKRFAAAFVVTAGPEIATGTIAEIIGPKMAARWAASGALAGTLFGSGIIVAIGIGVAEGLKKLKENIIDPFMKKYLGDKVGGAIGGIRDFIGKNVPNPLTNQIFGGGSHEHDDKKKGDDLKKQLKDIGDLSKGISGKGAAELNKQLGFLGENVKPAKDGIKDVSKTAKDRFAEAGDATDDWRHKIHIMVRDSQGKFADMTSNVRLNTQLINKALGNPAGRTALTVNMQEIVKVIKKTMSRGGEITDTGLNLIKRLYANELRFYGLSPKEAIAGANLRTGQDVGGHRRGDEVGKDPHQYGATGGWAGEAISAYRSGGRVIGRWGERGRDKVHAVLGRGEAVLNHAQQRLVNKALQVAGVAGGLPAVFNATRGSKHYMAGGGIVGIPGSPGESADRRIIPDILRLRSRYRAHINDAYSLDPVHAGNGEHPLGLAVDWIPGPKGNWDLIDSFAHWAEPSQNNPRPPFRWVGYDGDANHGRYNHLHTSWDHGPGNPPAWVKTLQGKIIGQTVAKIKRVIIHGTDGPLKTMMQGTMDNARRAANKKLSRKLSQSAGFGGESGGFGNIPGGDGTNDENRALGKRMAEQFAGWGHGSEWHALDDLWGHLEGSWDENLANLEGSGAYGIAQALPSSKYPAAGEPSAPPGFKKAAAQIGWGLNYIQDTYKDPIGAHSARLAKGWYEQGGFAGLPFIGGLAGGLEGLPFAPGVNSGPPPKHTHRTIEKFEGDIEGLGNRYTLDSSWAALTEEEFINEGDENTPPSLNQQAISQRLAELDKLIKTRDKITKKYQKMIEYIEKLMATYAKLRRRLIDSIHGMNTSLRNLAGRPGKEARRARRWLEKSIGETTGQVQGIDDEVKNYLSPKLISARVEEESSRIDRQSLENEAIPLRGGGAGLTLPDWQPPGPTADQTAIAEQANRRAEASASEAHALRSALLTFAGSGDLGSAGPTAKAAVLHPTGVPGPGYAVGPRGELIPIVAAGGGGANFGGNVPSGATDAVNRDSGLTINFHSAIPPTRDQAAMIAAAAVSGIDSQGARIASRTVFDV